MADMKEKLKEFHDKFRTQAEDVVTEKFPDKVFELDNLLKSDLFSKNELEKVHNSTKLPSPPGLKTHNAVEPVAKKRRISNEHHESQALRDDQMPSNEYIVSIIDILKPHIQYLMEQCNMVKMWIQLQIPRIEDGNNFGVSIQEETLGEVQRIEGEAATFLDQISRYFITRAKIGSKVVKYPYLDDYRRAILELDEKEFITLRLCCCELRNHYLCLHDSITKNIEKIKRPRTSNAHSLY